MNNAQEIFEDAGYECRSYSGRGMYGKDCLGVEVEDLGKFIGEVFYEVAGREEGICEEMGDLFRSMRTDNMGEDIIVYFPDTPYSSPYADESEEFD